jgi:hypothetical protein
MAARKDNWLVRLLLTFYGPASNRPVNEPRTRPEVQPPACPLCGEPLAGHSVRRVDGRSRTQCPRPSPGTAAKPI